MKKKTKRAVYSISLMASAMLLLDQVTKLFANIHFHTPLEIIENFFRFQYSENTGIAFSIAIPPLVIIALNITLLFVLANLSKKELKLSHRITQFSLAMIFAGAIGNLIDRLMYGYVIDFISIWRYPIFNVADIYIVVGILLIMINYKKIKRI